MNDEPQGWLLVINNASKKKIEYFIHPLKEKLENLLVDESLKSKGEI
jgi:hypothetical protein